MTADDIRRLAAELGFDAIGVARAEAYVETERHIADRRARGLFAEMKFTMAQPERSCHPETLLPGARSVVSVAHGYWRPEQPLEPGEGRLARYTWSDAYAEVRERLDLLGRAIGGAYRVLVDANQHVDREAAARSGVGFYGKNTMLITRRHGSWVVLGTLVSDRELEATPPLDADCGECRICIDACPTGALDEPGTLDATKCLSYWTQSPEPIPEEYRSALGAQVYGCDICQDVCPWNRGVQKRRGEDEPSGAGHVDLVTWLESDTLVDDYERLYVPRNDVRFLRRNALVALGNVGGTEHASVLEQHAADEHGRWALEQVRSRA
jgi:epoxyqueuosine reductase